MAFIKCPECGKEMSDQAERCLHCGYPIRAAAQTYVPDGVKREELQDESSTGLNILAFCIPLVGLILYCVHLGKYPRRASAIGKWALIGLVVGIVAMMFLSF